MWSCNHILILNYNESYLRFRILVKGHIGVLIQTTGRIYYKLYARLRITRIINYRWCPHLLYLCESYCDSYMLCSALVVLFVAGWRTMIYFSYIKFHSECSNFSIYQIENYLWFKFLYISYHQKFNNHPNLADLSLANILIQIENFCRFGMSHDCMHFTI